MAIIEPQYNERTSELVWNIKDVPAFTGILLPAKELIFQINEYLKSKLHRDLQAYMRVENAEENAVSDIVKVPIKIERKDSSINIYNLILFDFNRSDLNPTNRRIAEFIDSDIRDDASVQVIGHTDRIGNDDYNKNS